MREVEELVQEAWRRIRPGLLAQPDELRRRLARQRTATLLRPPRAWCLAVRASDTRINLVNAIISPADAVDPHDLDHPGAINSRGWESGLESVRTFIPRQSLACPKMSHFCACVWDMLPTKPSPTGV
jgi:hypothetical protein